MDYVATLNKNVHTTHLDKLVTIEQETENTTSTEQQLTSNLDGEN